MNPLQFTIPVTSEKTVIIQEDCLPRFYPHLHRHKEAQLMWICRGRGMLIADSAMHLFQPNDIFLIAPHQSHVFKDEPDEAGIHTLSIYFDPEGCLHHTFLLPELKPLENLFRDSKGGFKVPAVCNAGIADRMSNIQRATNIDQFVQFLSLLHMLSKITPRPAPLAQQTDTYITEGEGLRMANIYNYINQHYHREISLEEVAAEAHLTPQAFCRYFKKHTGITFIAFLNRRRINEACKGLTEGRFDSIANVAYSCGFNSITNFNRVFKTVTGDSPKTYLAKYYQNVAN